MSSFIRLITCVACVAGIASLSAKEPSTVASGAAQTGPSTPVLKVIKEVKPAFPQRLLNDGVPRGEVVAAICVDEQGGIADLLLVRYTHAEFARVVTEALKQWRFQPLMSEGKALRAIAEVQFRFETNGVLVVHRPIAVPIEAELSPIARYVYEPCAPSELDRDLAAKRMVKPIYPKELSDKRITGDVFIEFYIDETGRTRLPVATWSHHDILAAIAANAVEQWQFEPPTRQGRPVIVKAKQKFTFVPEGTKSPESRSSERS